MTIRGRDRQFRAGPPRAHPASHRAFTLVELLMAMMVGGIILTCVVTLASVLGNYQNEGDGVVELATHGRFATTMLTRDVRCARAAAVSSTGGLVLWMGDLDNDTRMESQEFVIYYKPSQAAVVRRLSFSAGYELGSISPSSMQLAVNAFDTGSLVLLAQTLGLQARNEVVCRDVNSAAFYANRALPRTKQIEVALALSCDQNVMAGTGRPVSLTIYDSAALRAPCTENGFAPEY
jgi:prepilin-type N-terminal cleavage/methylation domain-containing protein